MRSTILLFALAVAGCALSNTSGEPTGGVGLSRSGAGPYIGASAGSSVGGGPLGAGTDDNRAGSK